MNAGLAYLNEPINTFRLAVRNDAGSDQAYWWGMKAARHPWYLKEWLEQLGASQADLVRELEMNKAKASLLVNGKQPYHQDDISAISTFLNIQPYELLMHPADALAIRQMRESAAQIAAGQRGSGPFTVEVEPVTVAELRERRANAAPAPSDSRKKKRTGT